MTDLETLDTTPSSVVLTLGAVKFDPFSNAPMKELYLRFNVEDQEALGCTVSESTIEWWGKQDPAVMEDAFTDTDRLPLTEAIDLYHKFAWNSAEFWGQGCGFDYEILQHIYDKLNRATPWQFWQVRDSRTLFNIGIDPELPATTEKHNALVDARRQAIGVRNVFKAIGYTGKKF
jgi:hypothetical protein